MIVAHSVGTPVTTLITIDVANSRMPSASDRVTRKSPADERRDAPPEASLQQLVRGDEVAAEVGRDEQRAHDRCGR